MPEVQRVGRPRYGRAMAERRAKAAAPNEHAEMLARVLRVAEPPARSITHAAVADTIILPDGPQQGKRYRWRSDPVHAAVISALDAGYESLALPGAVQTGKSLASVLVPLLRQVTHRRANVVYAQPTQTKLHEAWAGKVQPSIAGSGMSDWLPAVGQGGRGGQTPKFVVFREPVTHARAGMLYLIHGGGKTEGAQASVSAPTVLVDEVDSFPSAHRVALIAKRADSFGKHAVRVYTSTVKADGDIGTTTGSIILGLYHDSTRSRLHYACPRCGGWQRLSWGQVTYDDESEASAASTVRYICARCHEHLTDEERLSMLANWRCVAHTQTVRDSDGVVLGQEPATRRFGLLWTALDSTLRDLPTLAIEHWRAKQAVARADHSLMRSFYRDQLSEPYRADSAAEEGNQAVIPTRDRLAALSVISDMELAVDEKVPDGDSFHAVAMPPWVSHVTVAVDVQRGGGSAPGRLYFVAIGRGEGRGCIAAWGAYISCPIGRQPTTQELHISLDRLDERLRRWGESHTTPIVRRGVDTGDRQDEIVRWILSRKGWVSVHGIGRSQATVKPGDLPGWLYRRPQSAGWMQHFIETRSLVRIVQGELLSARGAGSMAMPQGQMRNAALIQHFCSTVEYAPGKWSEAVKDRQHHPEWQARDDYLQCAAYARALAHDFETAQHVLAVRKKNRRYGYMGDI